jgi:hypothetical protein
LYKCVRRCTCACTRQEARATLPLHRVHNMQPTRTHGDCTYKECHSRISTHSLHISQGTHQLLLLCNVFHERARAGECTLAFKGMSPRGGCLSDCTSVSIVDRIGRSISLALQREVSYVYNYTSKQPEDFMVIPCASILVKVLIVLPAALVMKHVSQHLGKLMVMAPILLLTQQNYTVPTSCR